MKIAIFVSGNGSNLQAIIDAKKANKIVSEIALVISSNDKAFALERAKKENIETLVFQTKDFKDPYSKDKAIINKLKEQHIDLIVLAGYMCILTDDFVDAYPNKIINIHPSLLPSFKGAHAIKDAFEHGVKTTGVTVHFVDKQLDNGPIILQQAIEVEEGTTVCSLEEKIHQIEHLLYPQAISLIEQNKVFIKGRKVTIS